MDEIPDLPSSTSAEAGEKELREEEERKFEEERRADNYNGEGNGAIEGENKVDEEEIEEEFEGENEIEEKEEDVNFENDDIKSKWKGTLSKVFDFVLSIIIIWLIIKTYKKTQPKAFLDEKSSVNNVKSDNLPDPPSTPKDHMIERDPSPDHFDSYEKFIFVGGIPGAGVSLMRAILDAHPEVRCGNSKDVIYKLMLTWRKVAYSKPLLERMRLGGVNERVIDISMILFIIEIMANNGPPAPRLCTSDPLIMIGGRYLYHIFPNMKMVFMIRDVRAAAYSVFRRKNKIGITKLKTIEMAIRVVDQFIQIMREECHLLGTDRCLPVRYENLVLRPRETMEKVLQFLNLPWKEEVMHHYFYANKTGVYIDPVSNDTEPIFDSSLTSWVGNIPSYITDFPAFYMKHLEFLGYDPKAFPPDYSRLPRYNWTKPEEPTPKRKLESLEFMRLIAKVAAAGSGI